MAKLVVDSSVAIKWFVAAPHSAQARAILAGYESGDLDLFAPDLVYAEVGNIVWKKQRLTQITTVDAQEIIDTFGLIKLIIAPSSELLGEAYRIAVTYQRTVYDSLYVALSQLEGCSFVTADERLVNAIQSAFPQVAWIGDWPLRNDETPEEQPSE